MITYEWKSDSGFKLSNGNNDNLNVAALTVATNVI